MLPSHWDVAALDSCAEVLTGFAFQSEKYVEQSSSSVRLLRGDNIVPGSLRWDDAKFYPTPDDDSLIRYEMREGDIVIALDRPIVGAGLKCSVVRTSDIPSLLVQRVARLRAATGIDQRFLAQTVQTRRFISHLRNSKTETAVPHVSPNDIRSYAVHLPPKEEQARIAEVLSTWDAAISAIEKLLTNGRLQKGAMIQRLLSDSSREQHGLPKMQRKHAEEIFVPSSIRRNDGLQLLSVMQDVGVVPRTSLDRKVVMPEGSTDSYKLVEPGDFVISLRSFEGGLEYSRYTGLVSPAYTVLKPKTKIVDDFYRHYFKSREFIGRLSIAVIGIRDGKQISYNDFAFLRIPEPPIKEQLRIAAILNVAEASIAKQEAALVRLRAEKSALMQQLLTGKRRVRIPAAEATP